MGHKSGGTYLDRWGGDAPSGVLRRQMMNRSGCFANPIRNRNRKHANTVKMLIVKGIKKSNKKYDELFAALYIHAPHRAERSLDRQILRIKHDGLLTEM